MADFINTIDALGDDAVVDSIIDRTITEFKDDRITTVRQRAFHNCVNLVTVDLPSAATINYGSFGGCNALTSLNIPAVTKIESHNAFSNCKALKEIVLPSCSHIGQGAFSFCFRLEKVDCAAPGSLEIGNSAFGSTTALKALVIRSNSVATMANKNALQESSIYYGTGYIYVPSALVDSYKSATNWSTYANQFRKLEEWTVDGTVTGELDIYNRHMVRFFNSDGTLLSYVIVATGSSATYDGDTPVYPEDSSWDFTGFSPSPTGVTADMDCYAQYREPIRFATSSWAKIAEVSESGQATEFFAVGDERDVPIAYADGTTATMTVKIAGFNHDDLADGSGKAGISIVCRTLPDYLTSWNTSNSNCSYGSSLVAKALAEGGDIYNMLPSELTAVIKPVNKKYDNSSSSGTPTLKTVSAPLWALSVDEVGAVGTSAASKPGSDNLSALGTRYALFPSLTLSNDSVLTSFQYLGSITQAQGQSGWLRSVYRVGSYRPKYAYANTYSNGTYNYGISDVANTSTKQYTIWFGFCI